MDEPEGMAVYSTCLFQYEGQDWELRAYAPSEAVIDGELALDDRCHFQLRAVSPDGVWVLFDDTVQLGVPQADVWVDVENGLHITLRDARSAPLPDHGLCVRRGAESVPGGGAHRPGGSQLLGAVLTEPPFRVILIRP